MRKLFIKKDCIFSESLIYTHQFLWLKIQETNKTETTCLPHKLKWQWKIVVEMWKFRKRETHSYTHSHNESNWYIVDDFVCDIRDENDFPNPKHFVCYHWKLNEQILQHWVSVYLLRKPNGQNRYNKTGKKVI